MIMKRTPGLVCNGIGKTFRTRSGRVVALANVSFTLSAEEFVCIVGPSGCGKSTLLKILADLVEPTSGSLVFPEASRNRPRNALVFQEHGLFPWMTVLDNVAFGLEMQGVRRREREARALRFLEQV
ncbi:MAG: ABC transporter, ATP-binding protein (cluster 10, nitrate/sulfonate/bicarbonate), partial [uncultured Chloroflexia bacterium]